MLLSKQIRGGQWKKRPYPPGDNFVGQTGQVSCQHMESPDIAELLPTQDSSYRKSIRSRCGFVDGSSNWLGLHAAQTP